MTGDTITNGGETYPAVWLPARVTQSKKPDLMIVQLIGLGEDFVEPPVYYVDPVLIKVSRELKPEETIDGQVKVFLLERNEEAGTIVVMVSGEAVSYDTTLEIPEVVAA